MTPQPTPEPAPVSPEELEAALHRQEHGYYMEPLKACKRMHDDEELIRRAVRELQAERDALKRHLTNIYQDQCENAYVEASVADAFRQALHETNPDHPALKGAPPSFGVWENLSRERDEARAATRNQSDGGKST